MMTYNEIMNRVDISKPFSQGVRIELESKSSSASAKINFDNELFWVNEIVVTGRDASGKILDTAGDRELITATFNDNFKVKYQGNESQEIFGLNNTHLKRPNFGWLIKPNAEMTVTLQSTPNDDGTDANTFPYIIQIDMKGFVVEPPPVQ